MNGYQYLVARNRLMQHLEDQLRKLAPMAKADREAKERQLRAEFDIRLRELYAQVADEYPGERKKKARPLSDPR
ncbi:MAG TPA: hypothetical protein VMH37_01540 [Candidatus Binataceae bacterium]|nr:hypothetical protein [Candidatus Binataceae bacterium]